MNILTGIDYSIKKEVADSVTQTIKIINMYPDKNGITNPSSLLESKVRNFLGGVIGLSLQNAIPSLMQACKQCIAVNAISEYSAINFPGNLKVWIISIDEKPDITGLITKNSEGQWVTFIEIKDNVVVSINAVPFSQDKSLSYEIKNLETLCERMVNYNNVGSFSVAGNYKVGRFDPVGFGNADIWKAYAQAIRPMVMDHIPEINLGGVNMEYLTMFAPEVIKTDGGFHGPVCSQVLHDLISYQNGHVLLYAAKNLFKVCKEIEKIGATNGIRLFCHDGDKRFFTLRDTSNNRLLLGYENIDYIEDPKEFVIIGTWDSNMNSTTLPSRISCYPVYGGKEKDLDDEFDRYEIEEICANPSACPPRLGIGDIIQAFYENNLPVPMGMLDITTGLVTLNDLKTDCVTRGCFGVTVALALDFPDLTEEDKENDVFELRTDSRIQTFNITKTLK